MSMNDPLKPSPALLAKLGSLVYHLEEFLDDGHAFDKAAAASLREDEEVEEWFAGMRDLAMLPVKRSASRT
jgi:hypothetical protein